MRDPRHVSVLTPAEGVFLGGLLLASLLGVGSALLGAL